MEKIKILSIFCFFVIINLSAETVLPYQRSVKGTSRNAVASGGAGLIINSRCYGTNNRGTSNPMSPSSRIVLHVQEFDNSRVETSNSILIDFPSSLVTPDGAKGGPTCGLTVVKDQMINTGGNIVKINDVMSALAAGDQNTYIKTFSINNLNALMARSEISCEIFPISFTTPANFTMSNVFYVNAYQVFNSPVNPAEFFGYNGRMDRGTKIDIKKNSLKSGYKEASEFLQITADFPGQDGFCGGFHSPLMFFFDDNYPTFTGSSNLLRGKDITTSWVEVDHPGYFLVKLDNSKDEIKAENLFGDDKDNRNGFTKLKKLDSNKDGVLNKRDKAFSKLYLWKDKNSNSKNEIGEIVSIKEFKIESIDLNYNETYRLERNKAIFQGSSTFKVRSENGKLEEHQIYDVFFENLK